MTPWERVQARRAEIEQRRHRRPPVGPRQRGRWQDRRLDERTAKAIAAVLNLPAPRRRAGGRIAAVAALQPEGWAVLVPSVEGGGDMERLLTLGDCAPHLRRAMKATAQRGVRRDHGVDRPTGAPPRDPGAEGRGERGGRGGAAVPLADAVEPGEAAFRQVREALDEATCQATCQVASQVASHMEACPPAEGDDGGAAVSGRGAVREGSGQTTDREGTR